MNADPLEKRRAYDRHRSARKHPRRARTLSMRMMRRALPLDVPEFPGELLAERPRTRGECIDGPRPCPFVSCRHHLYLDVSEERGSIKLNFPDLEPWELEQTCALDVAATRGGVSLERVGELLNLTRERVRQVEARAKESLAPIARRRRLHLVAA